MVFHINAKESSQAFRQTSEQAYFPSTTRLNLLTFKGNIPPISHCVIDTKNNEWGINDCTLLPRIAKTDENSNPFIWLEVVFALQRIECNPVKMN